MTRRRRGQSLRSRVHARGQLSWSARALGRWPGWEEVPPTRRTSGPLPSADTPSPRYRHALQRRCIFDSLGKIRLQFRQRSCRMPSGHRLPKAGDVGHWELHHLSMIRNAVGAQYRVGAEWARRTHRRHGISLSRGHGARWYRPRGGGGRTRSHPDSVTRCSSISGGGLPSLPLRFGPLALALHGRLLVVGPPLHFLEHSALQHLPLEGLQRRLDLVIDDLDPQWRTFLPPHGASWPPLTPRPGPRHGQPRRSRHRTRASQFLPWPHAARRGPIVGPDPAPRDARNGGARERDPSRPVPRGPSRFRCTMLTTSPRSLDGSGQDAWRDSRGWSSQQGPLPCMTTVVH